MRKTPKILIVDDEPDILNLMQINLRRKGFQTISAASGEDAIQIALGVKPDLILMDVNLPGINGMQACQKIKAQSSTFIPTILVTVKKDLKSKISGSNHGADDFLTKPFIMEELFAKIQNMLRIKKLYDDLERSSITDPLTGVYNRRYFQLRLKEECDRSRRTEKPLSCLMFDLDHFKKINDTFGHQFGDAVLKHFSDIVKGFIRKTDIFARYGGEEFILILPETEAYKGKRMGELIRMAIESNLLSAGKENVTVTVSVGVCGFPNPQIRDFDKLVKCLDDALYQAKKEGRNRVKMFSPPDNGKDHLKILNS